MKPRTRVVRLLQNVAINATANFLVGNLTTAAMKWLPGKPRLSTCNAVHGPHPRRPARIATGRYVSLLRTSYDGRGGLGAFASKYRPANGAMQPGISEPRTSASGR